MINYPSRGSYNFLGLENVKPEESDVVIFPVPYDSTTSYRPGTRFAPRAIILASNELETFDLELKKDLSRVKICTLPELEPDVSSPEGTIDLVSRVIDQVLTLEKFPIMLGGEHTVAVGGVKAAVKHYSDLSVLSLDAHADLRNSFQNSEYSHACTMRRVLDYCQKVVWVGVRSMSEEEYMLIKDKGLKVYSKVENTNEILEQLSDNVYLTIDLDVFDPSIISVGTPVPAGLKWEEVLKLLRRLFKERNVIATDVVELLPVQGRTSEDLAAQLVLKLIGYKFF